MSASESKPLTIRTAQEDDLPALFALCREALVLDTFSPQLLAEKLFRNPRPNEFCWDVYLAEDASRVVGLMQSVVRPAAGKAWLGLFAVAAASRRRGIGTELLRQAQKAWSGEITEVEVLAIPGNYFAPGLDPRYTEALCFVERAGWKRFKDCVNLTADLSARFDTSAEQRRLRAAGIDVRRARPDDAGLLDVFFSEHFGPDWRFEAELALRNDPPALHLALRDERLIAFSAHSAQNREWGFFGPMGTAPEARGSGFGRVLLWLCLNDLRDAGHRTAVIPWVGPIAFYQQWAGCRVERVFWRYRLERTASSTG
ncbi:MAG: GNAT family N-acetyltransferase [Planctomycetes bacterium]|nr:GNAT family N-acetyltransferase [Planctomycetota bacterium]